jgi:hypothetical protein
MVIRCECGVEIPYVSDQGVLRKTIETHAETHRIIEPNCSKTDAANEGEAELVVVRIKDMLMAQAQRLCRKIGTTLQ